MQSKINFPDNCLGYPRTSNNLVTVISKETGSEWIIYFDTYELFQSLDDDEMEKQNEDMKKYISTITSIKQLKSIILPLFVKSY